MNQDNMLYEPNSASRPVRQKKHLDDIAPRMHASILMADTKSKEDIKDDDEENNKHLGPMNMHKSRVDSYADR